MANSAPFVSLPSFEILLLKQQSSPHRSPASSSQPIWKASRPSTVRNLSRTGTSNNPEVEPCAFGISDTWHWPLSVKVLPHRSVQMEPCRSCKFRASCRGRGPSSSSSSTVNSLETRKGIVLNPFVERFVSEQTKTLLRLPKLTDSGRLTPAIWKVVKEHISAKESGIVDEVAAAGTLVEDETLGEVDRFDRRADALVVDNTGPQQEILRQKRRTSVLSIVARDVDVTRKGISWVKEAILSGGKDSKLRVSVDNSGSGKEGDGWLVSEKIRKHADEILHLRRIGMTRKLDCVEEQRYLNQAVEFVRQKTSLLKNELAYMSEVKKALVKGGEPLWTWLMIAGKRTGVDKIIARDLEVIQEGITFVKEEVQELLRMRALEDSSAVYELSRPWPQPAYDGLSGRDVLLADKEALRSYALYIRGLLNRWRTPLQLSYDSQSVASYFNHRPHLLVFRFLEVSAAFSSIGLQLLIEKANLWRDESDSVVENGASREDRESAEVLKCILLRLGPTFIKVAQSLSSRPDLIGPYTAKVLSELQDRLPPFPRKYAMAVIEEELGVSASQVFSYFSEDPVGAASFGQVYRARTVEGEEVAVKVQRPDLLFDVARDIYILRLGLGALRKLAKLNSDISVLADELGHGLFGELDYTLEAANAREFDISHKQLEYVKVPRTLPHLTRRRVLTMEWVNGDRPLDLKLIADGGHLDNGELDNMDHLEAKLRLDSLVRKGVECSLVQLLETGVLHADPHPGNLLYSREGNLAYLDFGLLAHVEKKHQSAMLAVIAHLVNGEWQCLADDFADLEILKSSTDLFALRLALERALGEGPDAVVHNGVPDIQFGQLTEKLWKIALKFRFHLPPYYILVLRSLASLEGLALSVDPNYKLFSAAYPYVIRRLLTDNSRESRRVLQSLILNENRTFRWNRIAALIGTSRKAFLGNVPQGPTDQLFDGFGGPLAKGLPHSKLSSLLSFTLSKEGAPVRRVLLEADTESLARSFVSDPASSLRRKVTLEIAEAFYCSITNMELECSNGRILDSKANIMVGTGSEPSGADILPGIMNGVPINSFQLLSGITVKHRLWFLLKVLASRLPASPILIFRVGWAFIKIVGCAAALALHRYAINLSDRLLFPGSKSASERGKQRHQEIHHPQEGGLPSSFAI